MAVPDLPTTPINSQILDTMFLHTWFKIRGEAMDNILNGNVVTAALKANGCFKKQVGERHISRPVRFGVKTAYNVAKGDTLDSVETEGETVALWNWKTTIVDITRSFQDDQMNSGAGKMKDLVATKLGWARDALNTKIEASILAAVDITGVGATAATGARATRDPYSIQNILPVVTDGTAGVPTSSYMNAAVGTYTYGGIDTGTGNTWWQCRGQQQHSPALMNLEKDMQQLYNYCGDQGADTPDLILMDQTRFEAYEDICANRIQLVQDVGSPLAKLGYEVLKYKGAQVVWSAHSAIAARDCVMMFNTKYIDVVYDPTSWFQMIPFMYLPNQLERVARIVCSWSGVVTNQLRRHGVTAAYTS